MTRSVRLLPVAGLLLVFLAIGTAPPAQAQEFGRIAETETNASYFFYAQPGEATIQVSLWGAGQAGLYEVPDSTHLDRLLTLAGGVPGVGEQQENVEPPEVTVRLYRDGRTEQDPVLETRIERLLRGEVEAPLLRENDVVVVEVKRFERGFTVLAGLGVTGTILSLANLILRILE